MHFSAIFFQRLDALDALLARAAQFLKISCQRHSKIDATALDERQVQSYDLAFCAAELAASRAVLDYAQRAAPHDALAPEFAQLFAVEVFAASVARLMLRAADFGLSFAEIAKCHPSNDSVLAHFGRGETLAKLGAALIARDGRLPPSLLDHDKELMRDSFTQFAAEVVAPHAQAIHRDDLDIPEEIIRGAAELGLFGVSIPQRFGGLQPDARPDTLAMLVVTEALSAASLGAAGSLITRPEIMARALLVGGTEAQCAYWLPKLATGEKLVAISITEPDFGSDVAGLKLRAVRCTGGWKLTGSKTWCTFAGRAEVILMIARTHPDPALGHRGLSQFIVEKPRLAGHEFLYLAPQGGRMTGRAIRTIGYRGMHSYDLFLEDLFVPDSAVVGEAAGLGKGFYYTMKGLAGGRVQTAGRANGVMQAAFDAALHYAQTRKVFGHSIASYPLMQARLARIAAWLTACRQLSYAVAQQLDAGGDEMRASLVKLFACRAAEWVTRDAMQMHGGVGYALESPASRYFVDARVLSIFEGAEETLALKVIARELIARA